MRTRQTVTVSLDGDVAGTLAKIAAVLDGESGVIAESATLSIELVVEDDFGQREETLDIVSGRISALVEQV